MKHVHWHKIWHDRLLSDPDYLTLSPAARGVLADLRCFAGRKGGNGETGHTKQTLLRWYGGCRTSVESALKSLEDRGLIEVETKTGMLLIPRWREAQESPAAARKRRQRERDKERDSRVTVTGNVTGEAEVEEEHNARISNPWAIWVDTWREHFRGRKPDPANLGKNTKATKRVAGIVNDETELREVFRRFLQDADPFLVRQGHSLALILTRLDAYRQSEPQRRERVVR